MFDLNKLNNAKHLNIPLKQENQMTLNSLSKRFQKYNKKVDNSLGMMIEAYQNIFKSMKDNLCNKIDSFEKKFFDKINSSESGNILEVIESIN